MQKVGPLLLGLALLQGCPTVNVQDGAAPTGGEFFSDTEDAPGITFPVVLSPACGAAGFFATGAANVTLAEDESTIVVSGLRYAQLANPVTGAHIHWGPPGLAGPIIFELSRTLPPPTSMTFTRGSYPASLPDEAPADYAAFVAEMIEGNTYMDIHTTVCWDGEIRGQLR